MPNLCLPEVPVWNLLKIIFTVKADQPGHCHLFVLDECFLVLYKKKRKNLILLSRCWQLKYQKKLSVNEVKCCIIIKMLQLAFKVNKNNWEAFRDTGEALRSVTEV